MVVVSQRDSVTVFDSAVPIVGKYFKSSFLKQDLNVRIIKKSQKKEEKSLKS